MPQNPSKLSRFWKELKRRRVVHVVTVYASAAFIIVELVSNLTEPLNLPPVLATIVIIVLAVGFPLAVILSWIYDLTGEGFERTGPVEESQEEQKVKVPNAWKVATIVSFAVILALITFNIMGRGQKLRAGDIQSLVILPFENFTGDDQMDHMVSGMHSLLIGDVGRVSGLRVTGKTSSRIYANANKSAGEIARELDVEGVVETTVTCIGDTICMQISLINATGKEDQVWIEDFRVEKGEFLNLSNQVTRMIAQEVMVELSPEEDQRLRRKSTFDADAMEAFLSSFSHWDDLNESSLKKSIEYLDEAVEKEPGWAQLYAGLAQCWGALVIMGGEAPDIGIPKVFENLAKAEELDPDHVQIHFNKGIFGVWLEWDWDKGEQGFQKALALNPSDARSRIYYAHLFACLNEHEKALWHGSMAAELEPFDPMIQALYAAIFMFVSDWEAAMKQIDHVLTLDPEHFFATQLSDIVAFHLDDKERVFEAFEAFLPFPGSFFDSIQDIYQDQGFELAYESVVQEMLNTGYGVPFDYAMRYSLLGQYDKALKWIEIGYEAHDMNMPYLTTGFASFDSLYDHPDFLKILDELELSLP